jgi:gluconolactonase
MDWDVCAHGYGLAEAPTIDVDGTLLFSDVLVGGIYRLTPNGQVTTVVPKRRGVGGLAVHADGGIVCSGRDVIHVRDDKTRTVLHVDHVAGWNDLTTDKAGRVYAGALRFAVFDPDADERTIYLSDTRARRIIVFDVDHATRRDVDVSQYGHPDGMAVDELGGLWVALVSGGIGRFTPEGVLDRRLEPPSAMTTSLCFDGPYLYVTTGDHAEKPELRGCVLRTRLDVPGVPPPAARV